MKLAIFFLVVLAFILRILFIFQGAVSFHYDMARDAFVALEIWKDYDFKILGPPTSTPGLYHGVLYYYLIAPFYALGQGDPRVVAVFLSLVNSLVVIPISLLAKDLFKSNIWAILAGLLFAVSFEATQYGPWLSNPGPAVGTVALFFLGLYFWQKGKNWGLYLASFSAALSSQFQLFLIYLFVLLLIFKFLFKTKINKKELAISFSLVLIGLSSLLIAAVKFGTFGQIVSGILVISNTTQFNFRIQFTNLFLDYLNRFADIFINNFLPTNVFLGGLLGFIVLYLAKENKFVLFALLSNILIFIFGGHNSTFVNVGMITPAILAVIIFLQKIWKLNKILAAFVIFLIILSNSYTIFQVAPGGQKALVIPKDMVLKNQFKLIDETYKQALGKPFSINTLTLPLWTNTTWAYLYSWYGKNKYGYVPKFYGHDQIGLLGEKSLEKINQPLEKSFFIIEPADGIPINFFNDEISAENGKTKLVSEISYGSLKLQVRIPLENEQ